MEEFIDEVHPYTEEDIRLLNEKYGKDLRKISAQFKSKTIVDISQQSYFLWKYDVEAFKTGN